MELFELSESCHLWSFGDEPNEPSIQTTLHAFHWLKKNSTLRKLGVVDIVPAYCQLAIHFDGNEKHHEQIATEVHRLLHNLPPAPPNSQEPLHTLPVDYCGEDLPRVAKLHSLSVEEVIQRHSAPIYRVAMIGFRPHFPYLYNLDPQLATPRLDSPRRNVPAGAVAIGGEQTGVYPEPSPGGWNLIGRTDPARLPAIRPGDRVRFIPEAAR